MSQETPNKPSPYLPEFKFLDPIEQALLAEKARGQLEKVGERPLKYMLAYLLGQRSMIMEAAVLEANVPPVNAAQSEWNTGRLSGRIEIVNQMIEGVVLTLEEKGASSIVMNQEDRLEAQQKAGDKA